MLKRDRVYSAGDPYAALGAAIVIQAIQEARAGCQEAATWLLSDGQMIIDGLGLDVDPQWLRRFVEQGCPVNGDNRKRHRKKVKD